MTVAVLVDERACQQEAVDKPLQLISCPIPLIPLIKHTKLHNALTVLLILMNGTTGFWKKDLIGFSWNGFTNKDQ